jgi:mycothiol synthase
MSCRDHTPHIGRVLIQDRAAALKQVFCHLEPENRRRQIREALAHASPPGIGPLDGLIGAWRGDRLVGAMFSQIAAGRNALLWLPHLLTGEPLSTAKQLYAATWKFFHHYDVALAKVLLSKADKTDLAMLRLGRFNHLATLFYLVSPECYYSATAPRGPINFEPCHNSNHQHWTRIIEATCEDTLDCAGLGDARNTKDVLAEYRSIGVFGPGLWWIAWHNGQAVGCVLLADHPQHNSMELLYLGLIPGARGRGWGRLLARHAQGVAGKAGRQRLILAVDAANRPALQTYMAVGFRAWERRRLYVRQLPSIHDWHTSLEQVFHDGRANVAGDFSLASRQT